MVVFVKEREVGGEVSKRRPERVLFEQGWADGDPELVQIGDRGVPKRIDVTFPSTEDLWPALHMTIEVRNGAPACTELTMRAHPEGREVRDLDFRHIRLDDWIETIVSEFAMELVTAPDGSQFWHKARTSGGRSAQEARQVRDSRKVVQQARRGSRRTVTDELLQGVAKTYRDHVRGRPVEAVSAAYGTSHRTAARYVQLARAKGYLPPTTQGRANG